MLVRVATCRDVLEECWLERSVFTDVGQSWLLSLLVKYWYIAV